jgi:hypothetical protein
MPGLDGTPANLTGGLFTNAPAAGINATLAPRTDAATQAAWAAVQKALLQAQRLGQPSDAAFQQALRLATTPRASPSPGPSSSQRAPTPSTANATNASAIPAAGRHRGAAASRTTLAAAPQPRDDGVIQAAEAPTTDAPGTQPQLPSTMLKVRAA